MTECPKCNTQSGKVVFAVHHPHDMEFPSGQSLPEGCIVAVENGYEIYGH